MPNNFIRTIRTGFPEGAVIATTDTLYMGFGFEGITGAGDPDRGHGSRHGLPAQGRNERTTIEGGASAPPSASL